MYVYFQRAPIHIYVYTCTNLPTFIYIWFLFSSYPYLFFSFFMLFYPGNQVCNITHMSILVLKFVSVYIHIGYEYELLCVMYVYLFFNLFFALFLNSCPKFAIPDKHFSIVFPGKHAISSWCNPASPSTRFLSLQSCHQLDCPGLYGSTTGTPGHQVFSLLLSAAFSILF